MGNGVWRPVHQALGSRLGPAVFAPGIADILHGNYTVSMQFLADLAGLAGPTHEGAVRRRCVRVCVVVGTVCGGVDDFPSLVYWCCHRRLPPRHPSLANPTPQTQPPPGCAPTPAPATSTRGGTSPSTSTCASPRWPRESTRRSPSSRRPRSRWQGRGEAVVIMTRRRWVSGSLTRRSWRCGARSGACGPPASFCPR